MKVFALGSLASISGVVSVAYVGCIIFGKRKVSLFNKFTDLKPRYNNQGD